MACRALASPKRCRKISGRPDLHHLDRRSGDDGFTFAIETPHPFQETAISACLSHVMSFVVALHAATYTLSFRLCWTTAGRRRSKTHKRFEIMHLRIRMLRLATAALAIAARCSTAFVFPRGRQQQTLQGGGGGGESTHQRQWGTGDTSSHAAPLSSKKIKANKRTQGAPPPWLTSVAGLRGGARASGEGGGSSVAVARGGAQVAAPSTTRLRRSMSVSSHHFFGFTHCSKIRPRRCMWWSCGLMCRGARGICVPSASFGSSNRQNPISARWL